jgi:NADH-quinone oxidoreductase subunit J
MLAVLPTWQEVAACKAFWAIFVGAAGVWLLFPGPLGSTYPNFDAFGLLSFFVPSRVPFRKTLGMLFVIIAAGLFASDWPLLGDWTSQGVFWFLAAVTLGAAVCTICSRSPVYSAIWFALSLLGTAGLFFFNGAQFLGVATIVVYAGAIVVTFLFVIMLAQPEGHSAYDRVTWGWFPKTFSVLAAATMVGLLTFLLGNLKIETAKPLSAETAVAVQERLHAAGGVMTREHMATFGQHLFAEHLISVELAGTLLLAALVGAIAIAIQGKPRLANRIEEALR